MLPNVFHFAGSGGVLEYAPRVLGLLVLTQAVCTDYELGIFPYIPLSIHLRNDYVLGMILAVSPWVSGEDAAMPAHWLPQVACAASMGGIALLTSLTAERRVQATRFTY